MDESELELESAIAETIDDTDELDEVVEQLTVLSLVSDERHDELVDGVSECRNQLESLLNRLITMERTQVAESPQIAVMTAELAEVKTQLTMLSVDLKRFMDTRQSHPKPSVSEEPITQEPEHDIQSPEESIEEPKQEDLPPVTKRRKVNRL